MTDDFCHLRIDDSQYRVWADFDAAAFATDVDSPVKILAAARTKVAEFKENGRCQWVEVYDQRFAAVCERLRCLPDSPPISVLVASGSPPLPGCLFEFKAESARREALLTLTVDRSLAAKWDPDWICLALRQFLKVRGIAFRPNPAVVAGALARYTKFSGLIDQFPIPAEPLADPTGTGHAWTLRKRRRQRQIDVVIGPRLQEITPHIFEQLLIELQDAARHLGAEVSYVDFSCIDSENLWNRLLISCCSPVRLGLQAPQSLLGSLLLPSEEVVTKIPSHQVFEAELARAVLGIAAARGWSSIDTFRNLMQPISAPAWEERIQALESSKFIARQEGSGGAISILSGCHPLNLKICPKNAVTEGQVGLVRAGLHALVELETEQRCMQAMTASITEDGLRTIAAMQRDFAFRLAKAQVTPASADAVVQCNMQIFPFTRLQPLNKSEMHSLKEEGPSHAPDSLCTFLVREMVGLAGFTGDPEWISARLFPYFDTSRIARSLDSLVKTGMLQVVNDTMGFRQSTRDVRTESTVTGASAMQFHQAMIAITESALRWSEPDRLQYIFLSLPINEDSWARVNDMIQEHLGEVFKLASKAKAPGQVFQIGIQAFPLLRA